MSPRRGITRRTALATGALGIATGLAGCSGALGFGPSVTEVWTTSVPEVTGGMTAHRETVYACVEHGLHAIDVESGTRRWRVSTGQNEPSSRPVVADETVYFGTLPFRGLPARLYAVTTEGHETWSVPLRSGASTCAIADGTVVTASGVMAGGPGLSAFDGETGTRQWAVSLDAHPVGSSPTVADGTVFIESGGFAAFGATTGDLTWRVERNNTEVGEAARHAPAVDDGTVYFSYSMAPEVYAFDAATGERLWTTETNARASTPVIVDGTLYVTTTDYSPDPPTGRLYALDPATGDERWSVRTGDGPLAGPVVREGTVYTTGHRTLYAIEATSGATRWTYEFDNSISAPVSAGELLFVHTPSLSSSGTTLYAVRQ